MRMSYYSSQEYSQEILFIPVLHPEITTHSNIFIENNSAIHNILTNQTNTSHYLDRR